MRERNCHVCLLLLHLCLMMMFNLNPSFGCSISPIFHGSWLQPGLNELIQINRTSMSSKGLCLEGDDQRRNKYLFFNEQTRCKRCLFFISRHFNVFQYRESECFDADDEHERICASITPDTVLYTLFRDRAEAIPCPIERVWSFAIDHGRPTFCQPKAFHPCATSETFRLSYDQQQCSDVIATCFAQFTDGNLHYVFSRRVKPKKFLCFSYIKSPSNSFPQEIFLSDDNHCRDFFNRDSLRSFSVLPSSRNQSQLVLPRWLQGTWFTLANQTSSMELNSSQLIYRHDRTIVRQYQFLRLIRSGHRIVRLRAHSFEQCSSVLYCIKVIYRSPSVIDLSIGLENDGCRASQKHWTLFQSDIPSDVPCPHRALYRSFSFNATLSSSCATGGMRSLSIGCEENQKNQLTLTSSCRHHLVPDVQVITSIQGVCLASWQTDHRFQRTVVLYEENKAFCLIQPLTSMIASWIISDLSCTMIDLSSIRIDNSLQYVEQCSANLSPFDSISVAANQRIYPFLFYFSLLIDVMRH